MQVPVKIVVLLGVLVAGIFVSFWLLGTTCPWIFCREVYVILAGSGMVITLYVMNRIALFRKKLQLAMRHMLDNNFQTGISLTGNDETAKLARDFNRIIDLINQYEVLREKKIFALNRIINVLTRSVNDGVMIFDIGTGRIRINRATQELFGISQDELSIDSVVKLEANSAFNGLYQEIITRNANTLSGDIELFLPILRAKAAVSIKLFAIKDKDEKLDTVVCLLGKA